MNARELETIVGRMLEEGVPAGVVARVFGLDHELVKDAQKKVRVKRYGTDDMTEYMEQLQWDAVDEARRIIESGSAADKSRMLGMVLGKQVALSARRTPESVRNSQSSVLELMESMRGQKAEKPKARSKFIASVDSEGA